MNDPTTDEIMEYWVTPQGEDTDKCLYHNQFNMSCNTLTYIIQQHCHQGKHLLINVQAGEDWTYCEPPITADSSNEHFLCYVNITGLPDEKRPTLTMDSIYNKSDGSHNIFSHLLKSSSPGNQPCKKHHTVYFGQTCFEPKLRVKNIHFANFTFLIGDNTLVFDNVHFDNVILFNYAEAIHSCNFYCNSCLFETGISDTTANNSKNFMINFQNCTNATLYINDGEIISTAIYVSFISGVFVEMSDVKSTVLMILTCLLLKLSWNSLKKQFRTTLMWLINHRISYLIIFNVTIIVYEVTVQCQTLHLQYT